MSKTDLAAVRRGLKADPFDLDTRLVLADLLEEGGQGDQATLQRRLVAFARYAWAQVSLRGVDGAAYRIGLNEGPRNVRVFTEATRPEPFPAWVPNRYLYAWVRKEDGAVFRGSWKKPEGPVRFLLEDERAWAVHVGPFGLIYLDFPRTT